MSEPWLLDRAMSAEARVDALLERVTVLERALEWYADPDTYDALGPQGTVKGTAWKLREDLGKRAREALDA